MTTRATWARRALTALLVAATTGFIAWVVIRNSRELAAHDWEVRPLMLAASLIAHTGVLTWGVFVWSRVARGFGIRDARFGDLLRVWAFSNVAKYIPAGAIWQFVAAARLANSTGLPQLVTLSSMIVHVLFSLASACLIAAATLPLGQLGVGVQVEWALRIAIPILAVGAVHPAVMNAGLRLVPRAMHREVLSWGASWAQGVGLLALALASWVLYGAAYFLFLRALTPLPLSALADATGVNALAFVAGYVAVFAPAGIGVKESAMTVLLTPLLPLGVAAVVSVAARLWSVASELALVLAAALTAGKPRPEPARVEEG